MSDVRDTSPAEGNGVPKEHESPATSVVYEEAMRIALFSVLARLDARLDRLGEWAAGMSQWARQSREGAGLDDRRQRRQVELVLAMAGIFLPVLGLFVLLNRVGWPA